MAAKGKKSTQRKLTAILCADVAGYSRLMGADEEATTRGRLCARVGSSLRHRALEKQITPADGPAPEGGWIG